MDDLRLRHDVLEELAFEPSIDASAIAVSVEAGVATLRGHVPNYAQKALAGQAALRVRGVRGVVADAVRVAIERADAASDDDLARRALTVLDLNVLVPRGAIHIKVHRGCLKLSGEVEWAFQRLAAIEDLRKLRGLTGLRDTVVQRLQSTALDAAQLKEDALARSAEVEAKAVRVSAGDSLMGLERVAGSWGDRARLQRTAWSAPGVCAVEDQVEIG